MNGIANNKKGQPLNKQDAESNDITGSKVAARVNAVTVNVFFDGTGNNMYNTKAKLEGEHVELSNNVSYNNYYSNVALLYMACSKTDKVEKIYIFGSGTFKHEEDTTLGLGFSRGGSGVYSRVTEAFKEVNNAIKEHSPKKITINVFGFSRGAFYARYFCAMAKLEAKEADIKSGRSELDYQSTGININLVGLYDTVSSEGLLHYNDVKPFRLNIGKQQGIAKIIHLTAQNEYRKHFPLTRVNTAASEGIAFECSFPGAHSDVGGSYNVDHNESFPENQYISISDTEENYLNRKSGEIHWSWFDKMGYYKSSTPVTAKAGDNGDYKLVEVKHFKLFGHYHQVYSRKAFNSNSYQFVILNIMKKMSMKFAKLTFSNPAGKTILAENIATIRQYPELTKFADYAYDYVDKNCTHSGLNFMVNASAVLSKEEQQEMYHKHIHNSLNPGSIPNGSDSRNKGPFNPERIMINDNS